METKYIIEFKISKLHEWGIGAQLDDKDEAVKRASDLLTDKHSKNPKSEFEIRVLEVTVKEVFIGFKP